MSARGATAPRTRRVLLATAAATTCGPLPAFLLGSQAVQIRADLGLDAGEIGTMVAVAWMGAAAFSSPLGRFAERNGGGRTLRGAALAAAAVLLGTAVFGGSVWALGALAAVGGIVNAATQPAANLLIARAVPAHQLGTAFAVKQSAIPLATLLGGLAVPTIALTLGWRWSYAGAAVLALGAAAAVPLRFDAEPEAVGGPATGHGPPLPTGSDPPPDTAPPAHRRHARPAPVSPPEPRPDPGWVPLAVLAGGVGLGAAAAGALTTFLTSAATDAGVPEGAAGLLLTAGSAIGIAVRLAAGARADRVGGGQLGVVAGMLAVGAGAFAAFALDVGWIYVALTPLAFGAGWSWPGLFNLSVVRSYPHRPAGATGVTQTGTYLGAGGGPLVVGWIADTHPWSLAWLATSALAAGAAAAVVAGRTALRRARPALGAERA